MFGRVESILLLGMFGRVESLLLLNTNEEECS